MNIFQPDSRYDLPVELYESRTRTYPFPNDTSHFIENRVYLQKTSEFEPPKTSTTTLIDNLFFVGVELMDRFGALTKYRLILANLPKKRTEPSTFAYEFPGYFGTERSPFTVTVNAQVEIDYFPTGDLGAGVAGIQVIERQKFMRGGEPTKWLSNPSPGSLLPSVPTQAQYASMITAGTLIVAEDSEISLYIGGIVERRTIRILPQ